MIVWNLDLVGYGRREIILNMNAYFEDGTLYDKVVNGIPTALASPSASTAMTSWLPWLKLTQASVVAGSDSQNVMCQAVAQALIDPTDGASIKITRVLGA